VVTTTQDAGITEGTLACGRYEIAYSEAGQGAPLVFLHGSGPGVSGMSNFARNLPAFATKFRSIVIDMPGYGRSPAREWSRPYAEHAAEAVVAFLDAIGVGQTHLLGNSMGGWVAIETALLAPDRVDRMVLMGPGGLYSTIFAPPASEGSARLREFIASPSRQAMRAWVATMVYDQELITDELLDERMANASAAGAIERMRAILASNAMPSSHGPVIALLNQVKHRTLVTWGRDDRMLPLEGAFYGTRQMPNADLHIFSQCGHWAQVERKSQFEQVAIDFLGAP
jgi:4,5:9,10-diseco-3-hydroxy-5,9,17-trioxoandrosta-1(10),2-diene-4-oate hydrolase